MKASPLWINVDGRIVPNGAEQICVSCGKPINGAVHAGHWIAKAIGTHEAVRFDERNLHPQCYYCNCMLDGNIVFYTEWMKRRYNEAVLEDLRVCSKIKVRWTMEILEWINKRAKANMERLRKGLPTKPITWHTIDHVWSLFGVKEIEP